MTIPVVNVIYDDEASAWVATSDDVPGLVTEADTLDEIVDNVTIMLSELLGPGLRDISHVDILVRMPTSHAKD